MADLRAFLRDTRLLLILDDFEHILPAAPVVGESTAAAPGLRALVTSRAPLRLDGEQEYRVPALRLPDLTRVSACLLSTS